MTPPIHTWERRHARLKTLADSINDSARMARGSLSLLLLVALYLGLTLVASNDENLLVNAQVALPQTGVGISIVQSYIFAPPIFLYLHVQTLYLLSVLAGKVQTFETTLTTDFPSATTQDEQNDFNAEREEYREWLSSFTFVQLFRPDNISLVPTVLIWIGTAVIPLLLLLAIAISFVRYQSLMATVSHHIMLLLDLLFVILFIRRDLKHTLVKLPSLAMDMLKVIWTFGLMFILILIFNSFPPRYNFITVEEDRNRIWRDSINSSLKDNLLDAGPCIWWGLCRYLDVSRKRLVKTRPKDVEDVVSLDLRNRNLRFAKLQSTQLQNADLTRAKLQGSDLSGSGLQGVDLSKAHLQSADLSFSKLQGAGLWNAWLQGASLYHAQLQGAHLNRAKLQGVSFSFAQLQGADLSSAQLQGTTFLQAQLQGAKLINAQLQGAELLGARLQGADLFGAQLQGADLTKAQLQGADLSKAQLQDSEHMLTTPRFVPISMCRTSFKWNKDEARKKYLDKLLCEMSEDMKSANIKPSDIKPAWGDYATLENHLQKRIVHKSKSLNSDDLVDNILPNQSNYSRIWPQWTLDFACQNEYAARSTMNRLETYYYFGCERESRPGARQNVQGYPIQTIFHTLDNARDNKEDCSGLRNIPDDEWDNFAHKLNQF